MCYSHWSLSRLRASRVLLVGVSGLGAEVGKNIVLAGVQEVTLLDHTPLDSADSACRFLMQQDGINVRPGLLCNHEFQSVLQRSEQAMLRLRTLNPNVTISADTGLLEEKDSNYLSRFDVIVVTCSTTEQLVSIGVCCMCVCACTCVCACRCEWTRCAGTSRSNFSVVMYGVTMVTSSQTWGTMSMQCESTNCMGAGWDHMISCDWCVGK